MQKQSDKLSKRAFKSIVSQTQTYSKQSCRYVEGVYPQYATFGSGALLYDTNGNSFVDYVCALGTNILGYANPKVNEAVINQIKQGTLYSLPHPSEIHLAEKIKSMIPSIELLRFLKSGSEAVSAGVKIARAYTGRDIVLSNGYHGWHDWSTPITEQSLGTPNSFESTIIKFNYNDIQDLEQLLAHNKVACVVLDPYIFDKPDDLYLSNLIKISHKHGALVLFDEVVTGIRWDKYSVQNSYGVKPDLTALGKSLANGFAISCIGGKKKIMKMLDSGCFVSSTYGGDLVGISAAIACLDIVTSENVPQQLAESGSMLLEGLKEIGIQSSGTPFRQRLDFKTLEHKALFWQECVKRGVFFGGAQHTSFAHSEVLINKTIDIAKEAMDVCKLYDDNPKLALEGKMPKPVSTIQNLR
jgi:glutamate-1-semialdehyde aminotransferase